MIPARARHQAGFTLLEVLISFALLAAAVGLLLSIVSGGLAQVRMAGERTEVAAIAQSLIAPLGVVEPLTPGEFGGESEDGRFRWHLRVEEVPTEALADPFAEPDPTDPEAGPEADLEAGSDSDGRAGGRAGGPALETVETAEEALGESPLEAFGAPILYRIELEVAPSQGAHVHRFATLRLRVPPPDAGMP
ncbi:MAG TPA: hypothetical protein DDZ76_02765 [Xanthomonadales bacterium]|nr:hypothetical protein [Xanthomonadales bacterium]